MSDRMRRQLDININTNVDTAKIKNAEKIINSFFDKYESRSLELGVNTKSLSVDTREFYKAIGAVQELEGEINNVRANAPMMLNALGADVGFADSVRSELKEVYAIFNDNSVVHGMDNIMLKLKEGFSLVAVDLGDRVRYLKDEIANIMSELRNMGATTATWSGLSFFSDDMSENVLARRIEQVQDLIAYQKELETFSGRSFKAMDAPIGATTVNAESEVKSMGRILQELRSYNEQVEEQYQITTQQLARRKELINQAATDSAWYNDYDHNAAKQGVHDKEAYTESIESLRGYITEKEQLITQLQANESTLFRADGISDYVIQTQGYIEQYKGYMSELETLRTQGSGGTSGGFGGGDFTQIVEQLNAIRVAIDQIRTAFKPLTDAINAEDSALHRMLTSSIEDLNLLQQRFEQLSATVSEINSKPLNVTNVLQQTINNPANAFREQKNEAVELVKICKAYYDQLVAIDSKSRIFSKAGMLPKDVLDFQSYNADEIMSGLRGARSQKQLDAWTASAEDYKAKILEVMQLLQRTGLIQNNIQDITVPKTADKNVMNVDQTQANVNSVLSEVKSIRDQINVELQGIRTEIESIFKFDNLSPNYGAITTITDTIYQQFVELQTKINALELNLGLPTIVATAQAGTEGATSTDQGVGAASTETAANVEGAAQAIKHEGDEAAIAAQKKQEFIEANKLVAASGTQTASGLGVATNAIQTEGAAAEQFAAEIESATERAQTSIGRLQASQANIVAEFQKSGGTGSVHGGIASAFNADLSAAGVDASSITSTFKQRSITDEDGEQQQQYFVQLTAKMGDAITLTREYNVATGELIQTVSRFKEAKDSFNLDAAIETAKSKVEELSSRMGSFTIDLSEVRRASENIVDEASFDVFNNRVQDAEQKLSELRATLKSSKSLDPITNAENQMSTLDTVVERYRTSISKFSNVEGFSTLDGLLNSITQKMRNFNSATDGMAKATAVKEINQDINQFNAELGLVKAKYQENTRVVQEQKREVEALLSLQNKVYADKIKLAQAKEGDDTAAIERRIQLQETELDKKRQAIVYVGTISELEKNRAQNEEALAAVRNAQSEEQQLQNLIKLYGQYADARLAVAKFDNDTSGKVHDQERAQAMKEMAQAAEQLRTSYGVDVTSEETLMNSLSENRLLTQKQINFLLDEDLKRREQIVDMTRRASDAESTAAKKKQTTQNQNYGKSIYSREEGHYNTIDAKQRDLMSNVGLSDGFMQQIERYKSAFAELKTLREQFANDPEAANNVTLKQQFADAALKVEELRKNITGTFSEYQKFASVPAGSVLGQGVFDPAKFADSKTAMMDFAANVTNSKFQLEGFNQAGTEMYGVLDEGNGVVKQVTVAFNEATGQMLAHQTGTRSVTTSWQKLGGALKGTISRFTSMYTGFYMFYRIIAIVRSGINSIKELDTAMTELKKVTDESTASYERFLNAAAETSSKIGATTSEFVEATANFARLGYTMDESAGMAESAIVYKNVADGLDSIDASTESIISTMKAFGIQSDDTMGIVDRFNEVGNNFAITSAGIGEALKRSASALYEGGNTIDESIGLITAANSVVQDPEQVGKLLADYKVA